MRRALGAACAAVAVLVPAGLAGCAGAGPRATASTRDSFATAYVENGAAANAARTYWTAGRLSTPGRDQMRFACKGYSPGTSGSPWVMRFDPLTHTGLVIGVIGGYEDGGDTADVSYSPYFSEAIARLDTKAAGRP